MAGDKSPRAKDEMVKKRKREANDGETKPKRHRRQRQKDDGTERETNLESAALCRDTAVHHPNGVAHESSGGDVGWTISKPMGGRMLDIDPILTADEQHLILIYNTSIQVYNATDSLLVRRIPISTLDASAPQGSTPAAIVAARLSVRDSNFLWVACSDGNIYHIDWTTGAETSPSFRTASGTAKAMVVVPVADEEENDLIIVVESVKHRKMEAVAYLRRAGSAFKSKSILVLEKPAGDGLQLLEASPDGRILVGALHDRLFMGVASGASGGGLDQVHYELYSFDVPDLITTIDFRMYARSASNWGSGHKYQGGSDTVIDIIAGGARGAIYIYRDVVSRVQAVGKPQHVKDGIEVNKFHWHRKAVHSVKWSRDGNYFISAGSENVLVLWQVDTSKRNYLPHLSGSIENIVVSQAGSSYVLHLDDNTAVVISTAEMKPTAYVSGIQSATADVATPKDALVKRCWSVADQVRRPIPAAITPLESSKLHVCVGTGRQDTMSGEFSAPLLQTFDLGTFSSVSKQALARTQPTDVNMTNKGRTIDEPLVTHIAFSGDGKWLVSVDEWKPPESDVKNVGYEIGEQFIRERHEVYLKFWRVADGGEPMALVSRVNAPHATSQPEAVLDLAADPATACFATIGGDGIVRLWRPRTRQQDGVAVKSAAGDDAVYWVCSQLIAVGGYSSQELSTDVTGPAAAPKAQGSISFSEDGSTLFAAFGAVDRGAVYVIDTASGEVVRMLDGLWEGRLHAVCALSSFVVVLSDELRVYDVVSDELRYGIVVPQIPGVHELLQLAVDRSSGHFAVTLPLGSISSVGVFDPEDPEPLLVRSIPHRIVSLVSAPSATGFVALDDSAQIWVVAEGSDPSAVSTVQSLQDLQLDRPAEGGSRGELLVSEDADMASDAETDGEPEEDEAEDVDMHEVEDDWHPKAVPQQYLADIFDAAPAFAAPPVEDMFYKVVDLLAAARPLPAASA